MNDPLIERFKLSLRDELAVVAAAGRRNILLLLVVLHYLSWDATLRVYLTLSMQQCCVVVITYIVINKVHPYLKYRVI